ncbi:MAG: hypothetical protein UY41_C0008G0026 [Candidatus Moranbacteria bacterium GW2011_GWE1_49_15]|nr:MAG: hypothetical protein UX75_C0008G0021 [Candidatus Moranbacteria bacterium GW2011_GWE2_47_10]KKW07194.1 MAG: hypothetical protein UY41_C0008G0026 [Candidatus Moranbacteria bacterium GW2011_GWE1_49_15]
MSRGATGGLTYRIKGAIINFLVPFQHFAGPRPFGTGNSNGGPTEKRRYQSQKENGNEAYQIVS